MTVAQLRELLQAFDPQARVVVEGYEGGFDDVRAVVLVDLAVNVHSPADWYMGAHDVVHGPTRKPIERVAYLASKRRGERARVDVIMDAQGRVLSALPESK